MNQHQLICDNIFVNSSGSGDGRFREFHIKDKYKTVGEALNLFKDDELLSGPGESITSDISLFDPTK